MLYKLFFSLILCFFSLYVYESAPVKNFFSYKKTCIASPTQKESEKRNVTVQPDDPISFMQLTAKNEMNCKEDQFQLSLLAAMGNTQRKEAADPLASKLNKVT